MWLKVLGHESRSDSHQVIITQNVATKHRLRYFDLIFTKEILQNKNAQKTHNSTNKLKRHTKRHWIAHEWKLVKISTNLTQNALESLHGVQRSYISSSVHKLAPPRLPHSRNPSFPIASVGHITGNNVFRFCLVFTWFFLQYGTAYVVFRQSKTYSLIYNSYYDVRPMKTFY